MSLLKFTRWSLSASIVFVSTFFLRISLSIAQDSDVITYFKRLTKSTEWRLVGSTKMHFRTYHPQGMVISDDTVYFSSVEKIVPTEKYGEIREGYDRTPGDGVGYLFKADFQGNLIEKTTLGEHAMYHPGGIDFDGKYIWVPVAEYRPNSESIIYKIDPSKMEPTQVFRFRDHIGAIVHNTTDNTLHAVSWGSRKFYTWKLNEELKLVNTDLSSEKSGTANGHHYIDYQDCHFLKTRYMLCGGISKYKIPNLGEFQLGGLELVELRTEVAIHQIPVPRWVKPTLVMTFNPFYFELKDDHLRFYFMPEDDESTLYIFDTF